jgi:hypothetical protein
MLIFETKWFKNSNSKFSLTTKRTNLAPRGYHLFGNAIEERVIKAPISQDVKKAVQT